MTEKKQDALEGAIVDRGGELESVSRGELEVRISRSGAGEHGVEGGGVLGVPVAVSTRLFRGASRSWC